MIIRPYSSFVTLVCVDVGSDTSCNFMGLSVEWFPVLGFVENEPTKANLEFRRVPTVMTLISFDLPEEYRSLAYFTLKKTPCNLTWWHTFYCFRTIDFYHNSSKKS